MSTLKTARTTPSSTGEFPYLNWISHCWKKPVITPEQKTSPKSKTLFLMPWNPECDWYPSFSDLDITTKLWHSTLLGEKQPDIPDCFGCLVRVKQA